jgi:hypothetical protein
LKNIKTFQNHVLQIGSLLASCKQCPSCKVFMQAVDLVLPHLQVG